MEMFREQAALFKAQADVAKKQADFYAKAAATVNSQTVLQLKKSGEVSVRFKKKSPSLS
jgi:hypothetical protein